MRVTEQRPRGGLSGGVGFRVTAEQRVALDRLCEERHIGISDLAREAIELYLRVTTAAR